MVLDELLSIWWSRVKILDSRSKLLQNSTSHDWDESEWFLQTDPIAGREISDLPLSLQDLLMDHEHNNMNWLIIIPSNKNTT